MLQLKGEIIYFLLISQGCIFSMVKIQEIRFCTGALSDLVGFGYASNVLTKINRNA
jgi:hypothetical protein